MPQCMHLYVTSVKYPKIKNTNEKITDHAVKKAFRDS